MSFYLELQYSVVSVVGKKPDKKMILKESRQGQVVHCRTIAPSMSALMARKCDGDCVMGKLQWCTARWRWYHGAEARKFNGTMKMIRQCNIDVDLIVNFLYAAQLSQPIPLSLCHLKHCVYICMPFQCQGLPLLETQKMHEEKELIEVGRFYV